LGETESITVDPHKMGYCPYGAGAIVFRHGFLRDFNVEGAAYALDTGLPSQEDLGKFILEGSKPGAAAAAVWFNHRMMPLDTDGYGKILFDLCELAQSFFQLVERENQRLRRARCGFQLLPLSAPETNIVCLMILPARATALSQVDRLNRHLARRFGVRSVSSVQAYDYLVSKTRIEGSMAFLRQHPALGALEADVESVTVLRLVFMNRWVTGTNFDGETYMSDFLATLVAEAEAFLTATPEGSQGG
jgi:glutamate/tyrosine decarboxylase-like PLP-dependent enzyme